jgi:hypothetical protein
MAENTAAIHVGRLLEIRANAGYRHAQDVDELFDVVDKEIAKLPPSVSIVTVADWRKLPIMSSAASDRVLQRIALLNDRTERSSALATPDAPSAVLQFMRLIREAKLPDRKMFFDPDALVAWLKETLTPLETQRLRQFIAENG